MTPPTVSDYTLETSEYLDVSARLRQLGFHEPGGLTFLPLNFESASSVEELRRSLEAVTLRKLLIATDLPFGDIFSRDSRPPIAQNNSIELVLPTLFVTAALASENPALVIIALRVISKYATDYFRGVSSRQRIKLEMVYESPTGAYKKVSYEGPPDHVAQIVRSLEEISHD